MGILLADEPRVSVPMRQRQVRTLGSVLPALGVSITPSEDGHVSVRLPAEVAELFLLDLEQRARAWQEAMRKARLQEQTRQAELRAHSEETRRQMEGQEDAWATEYERLRVEGKGHREALRLVRGPAGGEAPLMTAVEMGIRAALSRRKARERGSRNAEICRLAGEGLTRWEISDRLRLTYALVHAVLKQAGVPVRVVRSIQSKVPPEWCKRGK